MREKQKTVSSAILLLTCLWLTHRGRLLEVQPIILMRHEEASKFIGSDPDRMTYMSSVRHLGTFVLWLL